MMILIIRFSCPPTIHFKFITKCDKCYYRVRQDGCFVSVSFSKREHLIDFKVSEETDVKVYS